MSNNRKQKVHSVLDSLTRKELEEYMGDKNYIDPQIKNWLEKIKVNREENHFQTIFKKLGENFTKAYDGSFKLGQAWIIAFVLECFYDKKYKIADLKEYLKAMIDNDKQLKEYVYEIMKDF